MGTEAAVRSMTPFSYHVLSVVAQSAEKEMVGSYARRVIAFVKDSFLIRDRSIVQFPRKAMRSYDDFRGDTKGTITPMTTTAGPNPAAIGFLNVFPEADLGRLGIGVIASLATNISTAALDLTRPSIKKSGADWTSSFNLPWIGANQ